MIAGERIHALDVLLAVGGILFANVLVFFGVFVLPADRAAILPPVAADRVALFQKECALTSAASRSSFRQKY